MSFVVFKNRKDHFKGICIHEALNEKIAKWDSVYLAVEMSQKDNLTKVRKQT